MNSAVVNVMRGSLWVLLVPAFLFAVMSFVTGITFGFALWQWDKLGPTIFWIAALAFPIIILSALKASVGSIPKLLTSLIACWGFVAFYVCMIIPRA